MAELIGVWVAALLTLAIFSFLFRENPAYRFAEHLLIGVSAGYYLVQYLDSTVYKKFWVPVFEQQQWWLLGGGVLGVLMLCRLHQRTEWLSRFAIAFYVAAWSGYLIPSVIDAQILAQVEGTLLSPLGTRSLWETFNELLLLTGVLGVLTYFYFSHEHKGLAKGASRLGVTVLMIGFGAFFGYTIMGRVTLLIGRFQFLLQGWLGLDLGA